MKKLVSMLTALALCLALATPMALADGAWNGQTATGWRWSSRALGLNHFEKVRDYAPGVFADVPAGAWYEEELAVLYERGLTEAGPDFAPEQGVTLGEAVSLAVRIHCIYNNWRVPAGQTDVEYALNMGILTPRQYEDFSLSASRRSFAAILVNAVPAEAVPGINTVMDGGIPDVSPEEPGGYGVYTLYRAGVLVGSDAQGTYHPGRGVTRAAAAVIAARIVEPALRRSVRFSGAESGVVLSRTSLTLFPGESVRLTASVQPANAASKSVSWISSETGSAVVDQDGTVTAVHPGRADITATNAAGFTAVCYVTVRSFPRYCFESADPERGKPVGAFRRTGPRGPTAAGRSASRPGTPGRRRSAGRWERRALIPRTGPRRRRGPPP